MESWWRERDDGVGFAHAFRMRRIHHEVSAYQEIEVYEHDSLGRVLVLDGYVQASEADEFVYHEMALHVPLLGRARTRATVLIVGGGDGGCLREALAHSFVERAVMVEIDARVIEVSNRFLGLAGDTDPRAEVVVADAGDYLAEAARAGRRFDVIVLDLTDPVGPSRRLFASAFCDDLARCLADGGVVVDSDSVFPTKAGPRFLQELCAGAPNLYSLMRTHRALPHIAAYRSVVPAYPGGEFAFFLYTKDGHDYREPAYAWQGRHYNPALHRASFALPTWWRALRCESET